MQLARTGRSWLLALRAVVGSLLTALVLWLGFLSVGQQWHGAWHQDAQSQEHHCAITLFAHGQVDFADAPILAPVPILATGERPSITVEVCPLSSGFRLLPGRAPPVLS